MANESHNKDTQTNARVENQEGVRDVVVCKDVEKFFGDGDNRIQVLKDVNLKIKEGELLMLVGPSGSGKTTLISIIAGILSHDSGDCFVFSKDINHLPHEDKTLFRGKEIGFVFQSFNLIPALTVAENVAIPLMIHEMEYEESLIKAKKALCDVGLEDKVNAYPKNLSGGQQQRVAIARSIIHEPKLIVCDEPTSALDHENGVKVLELLRNKALHGNRSIIVVTHDARIFEYADRIVHLEDGLIQKEVVNGDKESL